ncbi:uncharacterized protein LOC144208819 isoform X1 [Stigmatopora nigra]
MRPSPGFQMNLTSKGVVVHTTNFRQKADYTLEWSPVTLIHQQHVQENLNLWREIMFSEESRFCQGSLLVELKCGVDGGNLNGETYQDGFLQPMATAWDSFKTKCSSSQNWVYQ